MCIALIKKERKNDLASRQSQPSSLTSSSSCVYNIGSVDSFTLQSLSAIVLGKSSRQNTVSAQGIWSEVFTSQPTLVCQCVGEIRIRYGSYFPAVSLTLMIGEIGSKWS